jgi:mono/diheme cytochrome c family protein
MRAGRNLFVLLLVGAVCLLGGGVYYLKARGLSARAKPLAIEVWLARQARQLATPSRVRDLKTAVEVTPLLLAEARDHYADHCAVCHANDGSGKTMLGAGMFPPPPDLKETATQSLSDGEILNIIKEGIRFTGMPGFGGEDEDSWKLVAFIRHIPKLSAKEIELMKEINQLEIVENKNHDTH